MKRLMLFLVFAATAFAQTTRPHRPVNTFSIVARDPVTGDMGVAVQSHWFSVGSVVPWAEAGVGAVATQSFVDPTYGQKGLELMRSGKTSYQALRSLVGADKNSDVRQVAMVDSKGNAIVWTGSKDIIAAGHEILGCEIGSGELSNPETDAPGAKKVIMGRYEDGCLGSAQANLMANDKVWPAMAKAFTNAKGDLAERMLAALDAAQAVGGDIRGRQSAAIIVVKAKSSGKPWEDRIFDLRVDDSVEPLKELRRLVTLQRAYNHMNAGDLAVEHKDNEGALREYAAAEKLIDGQPGIDQSRLAEMTFWHAVALINMNRVDESLPLFQKAFKLHEGWRELVPRLPHSGLIPDDPALVKRITAR